MRRWAGSCPPRSRADAGVDRPGDVEGTEPVDVGHLDRGEVRARADVDGEPDVAGPEWHEPPQDDPGTDLRDLAQRPAQRRSDDVGEGDPLTRLGPHPHEVRQGRSGVHLHPGVDPPVTRRAPARHRDPAAHVGTAPVHEPGPGRHASGRWDAGERGSHETAREVGDGRERGRTPRHPQVVQVVLDGGDHPACHDVGVEHGQQPGAQHAAEGGRGGCVARDAAHHLGADRPQLDRQRAHRLTAQVGSQPRGQVGQPRLARPVGRETREGRDPGHRGDVDQVAAATPEHAGEHLAAQLGGGEEVQREQALELVGVEVGDVARDLDGGVVDEDVDRAVAALGPGHQSAPGRRGR